MPSSLGDLNVGNLCTLISPPLSVLVSPDELGLAVLLKYAEFDGLLPLRLVKLSLFGFRV